MEFQGHRLRAEASLGMDIDRSSTSAVQRASASVSTTSKSGRRPATPARPARRMDSPGEVEGERVAAHGSGLVVFLRWCRPGAGSPMRSCLIWPSRSAEAFGARPPHRVRSVRSPTVRVSPASASDWLGQRVAGPSPGHVGLALAS